MFTIWTIVKHFRDVLKLFSKDFGLTVAVKVIFIVNERLWKELRMLIKKILLRYLGMGFYDI